MWTPQEIQDRLIITEDPTTGQKRISIIDGPKRSGLMPQVSWATFVPVICAVALMLSVEVFVHCVMSPTSPEHTPPSVNQR
jgi:hypothetical protein